MLVQSFIERLRPLVGIKCWDYIVLWKLGNDHRCIEWMDCCCAGSESIENGGEELNIISYEASSSSSSSSLIHCRDIMFPHPRIKQCDLLDQLPSTMVLDSGVHAQTLLGNQPSWLNYSHNSDSSLSEETIGTRVLVPVSLGLVELFVTKQVPEDEKVIDFIMAQCNLFLEQQQTIMSSNSGGTDSLFQQQQQINNENLDDDLPNLHEQQFGNMTSSETNNNGISSFMEGNAYDESSIFTVPSSNGFFNHDQLEITQSRLMMRNKTVEDDHHHQMINEDYSFNRSDDSDPNNDDEDDAKYRRRTGKGPQSKNLMAERKRRKKLNDRLYSLRALVPKISKLDRASILGDAIEYVNELKQQVEELQVELEEHSSSDTEGTTKTQKDEPPTQSIKLGPKREHENFLNTASVNMISKQNQQQEQLLDNTNHDKIQQMEPQVEVFQIDGNEFFVKVFCEHKCGGFVRLMEALNSLGLEVTNVNTTRHTCLVSTIFKVQRKNDETVQVDVVKESLLELTRNPSRKIPNIHLSHNTTNNIDSDYHLHHQYSRQMNSHHLQHEMF